MNYLADKDELETALRYIENTLPQLVLADQASRDLRAAMLVVIAAALKP